MLRWAGSSASADVVECHFCTQKSRLQSHEGKAVVRDQLPIITGSVHHFLCPYCESWNIKNPATGEFVDNVQAVHEGAPPTVTALRNKRASRLEETPFCHNCLTNQQLQVQLIAGYLPSDVTSKEENELLNRLPRYKESLDARYPIVCPNCHGQVDDIIKERNWKAKARTVGGWLKNSGRLARDTATSTMLLDKEDLQTPSRLWLWQLKGTCWKILYASTAMAMAVEAGPASYGSFMRGKGPTTYLKHIAKFPWQFLLPTITLFFSFWDPTYRDRLLRGGRLDIVGKRRWFALQALCYLSRIAFIGEIYRATPYNQTALYIAAIIHCITLLGHRKIIWIRGPKRIKLKERTARSSSTATTPSATPLRPYSLASNAQRTGSPSRANEKKASPGLPTFGQVSMGSTPPISRMYKRHGFSHEEDDDMDEDDNPDQDVAPMDWQPFEDYGRTELPEVDMQDESSKNKEEIRLRPAVFNPVDEWNLDAYGMKGLDGLFAKGVSLDDMRMEGKAATSSSTKPLLQIALALLALTTSVGVYLAYQHSHKLGQVAP